MLADTAASEGPLTLLLLLGCVPTLASLLLSLWLLGLYCGLLLLLLLLLISDSLLADDTAAAGHAAAVAVKESTTDSL
jgi:hypothetical protein